MEVPQLNPVPNCPQRCQDVVNNFNRSLRKTGEMLAVSDGPDDAIQEAVELRSQMQQMGVHNPAAEAKLDLAIKVDKVASAGAISEIVRLERPIAAINAMAACAFGGCKVEKGDPLITAARRG